MALRISVILVLLPGTAFDAVAEESRSVRVEEGSFNAYGHWISEDGVVELVVERDKLFADGWQVYDLLGRSDAKPSLKRDNSPRTQLVWEVCQVRDQLFDEGKSVEEVVAACRDLLERSDLVDGQVTQEAGPVYQVPWKDGPALMDLGRRGPMPLPTLAPEEAEDKVLQLMNKMVQYLEDGNMIVVSSLPLPNIKFVPAVQREEVGRLLREASERFSPINAENWDEHPIISAGVAEQMRRPLPETRKGR